MVVIKYDTDFVWTFVSSVMLATITKYKSTKLKLKSPLPLLVISLKYSGAGAGVLLWSRDNSLQHHSLTYPQMTSTACGVHVKHRTVWWAEDILPVCTMHGSLSTTKIIFTYRDGEFKLSFYLDNKTDPWCISTDHNQTSHNPNKTLAIINNNIW